MFRFVFAAFRTISVDDELEAEIGIGKDVDELDVVGGGTKECEGTGGVDELNKWKELSEKSMSFKLARIKPCFVYPDILLNRD